MHRALIPAFHASLPAKMQWKKQLFSSTKTERKKPPSIRKLLSAENQICICQYPKPEQANLSTDAAKGTMLVCIGIHPEVIGSDFVGLGVLKPIGGSG